MKPLVERALGEVEDALDEGACQRAHGEVG